MNHIKEAAEFTRRAETYHIGTLLLIGDGDDGMGGGIYILATSGVEGYAMLINLEGGTNRCGLIPEIRYSYNVTDAALRVGIGHNAPYKVVKKKMTLKAAI
jgi:hypothetical protein